MIRRTHRRVLAVAFLLALPLGCFNVLDYDEVAFQDGSGGSSGVGTAGSGNSGGDGGSGGTANTGGGPSIAGSGGDAGPDACVPGQAVFTWDAPNTNEDGTCTTDLAGFKLYYGPDPGNYTHHTDVPLDSVQCSDTADSNECGVIQECSVTIVGLEPQFWYFAMTAYDSSGDESGHSNEVSKDLSCP